MLTITFFGRDPFLLLLIEQNGCTIEQKYSNGCLKKMGNLLELTFGIGGHKNR